MPLAVTTTRVADEHLDCHEHHRAGRAHHLGMRLDEFAELHGADELDIQLDGGVRLPPVARRAVIAMA